jgi:hypothetical protein
VRGGAARQWLPEYRKDQAGYLAWALLFLRVAWRALMMRVVSFSFFSFQILL